MSSRKKSLPMQYLLPAIFAFLSTLALTYAALKIFPKVGLMDRPQKYGLKRAPIPYYGGVVIFLVFFISVLLFIKLDIHLLGYLIGAILLVSVSFADDLFGLSPFFRLAMQVVAALLLVFAGIGINSISNPFGGPLVLDHNVFSFTLDDILVNVSVLGAIFTVIWVVSVVNTMNFLDGLNGLPSGVTAIAALTLFFLSTRPDIHYDISTQVPVATMSIILFAVCFAFWFFDFYPAKILMGDTGSVFLGFTLATLAIFSGGKVATAFLVLGFPILDAGWVILRRIVEGKSPFKGDLKHLHHRLLEAGFGHRKALFLIYALCAMFGGTAVFLEGKAKVYALVVLFLFMVGVAGWVVYSGKNRGRGSSH